MGKRFGRNQRRRMRELEAEVGMVVFTNKQLTGQLTIANGRVARLMNEIEEWNRRIASLLGSESAFLAKFPSYKVQRIERERAFVMGSMSVRRYASDPNMMSDYIDPVPVARDLYDILSVASEEDMIRFGRKAILLQELPSGEKLMCLAHVGQKELERRALMPEIIKYTAEQLARIWVTGSLRK